MGKSVETRVGKTGKITVAGSLKEGIDLALVIQVIRGTPLSWECHSHDKASVYAPTKPETAPYLILEYHKILFQTRIEIAECLQLERKEWPS